MNRTMSDCIAIESNCLCISRTVGKTKQALDTPALVVDLDVVDANIASISDVCQRHQVAWRPHIKGQKVPEIAHRMLAAGAIGVTCAKLGEAELMAASGIRDILLANQIVGCTKIARLMKLATIADVIVAVDNAENGRALAAAAEDNGIVLRVVVEVDTGLNCAGVGPGEPCLSLAKVLACEPALRFEGLMTWEGHAASIRNSDEKDLAVRHCLQQLTKCADLCRCGGIPVNIVSCGGTGTYWLSAAYPGVTEIQAGGGVFGDLRYGRSFGVNLPCALTVVSTVTSRPTSLRIVCDAGKKAMSVEAVPPYPVGIQGVRQVRFSAEHSVIDLDAPNDALRIGESVEFVVGYADLTVNLHDELYGVRNGRVVECWPIVGRGKFR